MLSIREGCMADNLKIERTIDDNGCRVETRVYETVIDGQKERIVETHVEKVPMELADRVIEKIVPVVANRKKETFKDGALVNTIVEELDRGTMKMGSPRVDAITKEDLVNVVREMASSKNSLTKEDLVNVVRETMKTPKDSLTKEDLVNVVKEMKTPKDTLTKDDLINVVKMAAPKETLTKDDLADVVREALNAVAKPIIKLPKKVAEEEVSVLPTKNNLLWDGLEILMYVVLSGELAFCLYQLVLKNWM